MPLFQAVQLLREQLESAPDLRIQFYGSRLDSIYQLVNENGLSGFVDIKGYVSKQEAQRVQQDADALLLLEAGTPGVLTGKLFEYIASGRPIIAIGPKQESAIGRLLSETGTGIALGTDRSLIVNELSSLIQETPPSWFRPRESKIAQYSRTAQADRLLKTVEELWRERLHSKGITQRH